jgi:cell division protein FtsX
MLLLALSYHVTVYFWRPLWRYHKVEGILGILLGLFICSIPAANLLDMLYDLLGNRMQKQDGLRLIFWLVLNIIVLLVGWFIITLGATRFTRI